MNVRIIIEVEPSRIDEKVRPSEVSETFLLPGTDVAGFRKMILERVELLLKTMGLSYDYE
jgi:hypothetical protein